MDISNFIERGNIKRSQGDPQGAIEEYTQALAYTDENANLIALIYFLCGITRSRSGDHENALQDFNRVIDLESKVEDTELISRVCVNRAHILSELGDKQKALKDCNQAIDINPHFALAYSTRAQINSSLSHRSSAIQDFLLAIDLYWQQSDSENYQKLLDLLRLELNTHFLELSQPGIYFEGGSGETLNNAIIIKGAENGNVGVAIEHQYLDMKFGCRNLTWKIDKQELLVENNRRYNQIDIQLRDGSDRTIFFEITDFFGKRSQTLAIASNTSS